MLFHTLLWQNCWMDALAIHTSALPPCLWLRYTFWKIIFVFFPPNVVSQLPWPKGLSHLYGDRASLCSEEWRWTASVWTGSCCGSSCLGAVNEAPEHYQRLEFMLLITLTWLTEDLKVLIWCTWVSISQVFNLNLKALIIDIMCYFLAIWQTAVAECPFHLADGIQPLLILFSQLKNICTKWNFLRVTDLFLWEAEWGNTNPSRTAVCTASLGKKLWFCLDN